MNKLRVIIHLPGELLLCCTGLAADMLGFGNIAAWCAAQLQPAAVRDPLGSAAEWTVDAACVLLAATVAVLLYLML